MGTVDPIRGAGKSDPLEPSQPAAPFMPTAVTKAKAEYDQALQQNDQLGQIQTSAKQLAEALIKYREEIEKAFAGQPSELSPYFDAVFESNDVIGGLSAQGTNPTARDALISDHTQNVQALFAKITPNAAGETRF